MSGVSFFFLFSFSIWRVILKFMVVNLSYSVREAHSMSTVAPQPEEDRFQ